MPPRAVEERTERTRALIGRLVACKRPKVRAKGRAGTRPVDDGPLAQALASRSSPTIRDLWEGGNGTYGSASEADAALAAHLYFWAQGEDLAALLRQAPRMQRHGERLDYHVARLVEKVADGKTIHQGRAERNGHDPATVNEEQPAEASSDPHRLARLFLRDRQHGKDRTVIFWADEWLGWQAGAYRTLLDKELNAGLTRSIKAEFDRIAAALLKVWQALPADKRGPKPVVQQVTTKVVGNANQALRGEVCVPSELRSPCWLGGNGPFPAADALVLRNGMIRLSDGRPSLLPLTPRLFTRTALDFNYDPSPPPPLNWQGFLRQLWGSDSETIETLQEWMGYLLTLDTSLQKILLMIGPTRSGKGTIARVIKGLIGEANICNPTLSSLGGPFGLQPLLDKSCAIISDARLSSRTDTAIVTENLLSISGEDQKTVDRKHMPSITAKLPVRFILISNELPRLSDASGALTGRLIILRMTTSFLGREDTTLTAELCKELPAILLWAMAGLRRLRERGRFVQPRSSAVIAQEMEELSSPITTFVKEECETGGNHSILVRELYEAWKRWAEPKGMKIIPEQTFGRDLRATIPGLEVSQPRHGAGRLRAYRGVRLRPPAATEEE